MRLVEEIQKARKEQNGLIINAGAYTHTSVAIHDALKILKIPIIEFMGNFIEFSLVTSYVKFVFQSRFVWGN